MRQMDQRLAAARAVPTFTLMREAAQAALRVLRANWPQAGRVLIMTGGGNNGGDGWMLAALMKQAALQVNEQPVVVQVIACSEDLAVIETIVNHRANKDLPGLLRKAGHRCSRPVIIVTGQSGTRL